MAVAACARTRARPSSCAGVSWAGGRTDPAERSRRSRTYTGLTLWGERCLCVRETPLLQRPRSRAYAMRHSTAQQGSAASSVRQGGHRARAERVGRGRAGGGRARRALRVSGVCAGCGCAPPHPPPPPLATPLSTTVQGLLSPSLRESTLTPWTAPICPLFSPSSCPRSPLFFSKRIHLDTLDSPYLSAVFTPPSCPRSPLFFSKRIHPDTLDTEKS